MARRPNVLLVFSDQEAYPLHLPPLDLPNRERLRERGVEFSRCYCSNPLCSPSRSTMMTGLWSHQAKVLQNADPANRSNPDLPLDLPTIGSVFGAAGYEVGYFGKWHLSWEHGLADYGFPEHYTGAHQNRGQVSDEGVAEAAANWLRVRTGDRPWLCIVSLVNPHDVFHSEWYAGVDYPRRAELPPNARDGLGDKHPLVARVLGVYRRLQRYGMIVPSTDDEWKRYIDLYCYLIELIDQHLGTVLDAAPDPENTVAIYTSDHGEMGGSHGMAAKYFLYEESVRIPLVVSYPQVTKRRDQCDALVSNVDLVPTLCSLTGVDWPARLPGDSLEPLLRDPRAGWRDAVFAEGDFGVFLTRERPERIEDMPSFQTRMVRTDAWKYVVYQDGFEELYSLRSDPGEMTNRAGEAGLEAVLAEMRGRLSKWQTETQDSLRIPTERATVGIALGLQ